MRGWYGRGWGVVALGIVPALGLWPASTWACTVCWGANDALAQGLNVSIAFLMAMPFLVGGSMLGIIVLAQRRAQGRRWADVFAGPPGVRGEEEESR